MPLLVNIIEVYTISNKKIGIFRGLQVNLSESTNLADEWEPMRLA
jgi:hypothetical protein